MSRRAQNWIFLGDSLTEGVGSSRVSHVHELTSQLRDEALTHGDPIRVNELRLRGVDPGGFNSFVQFNVAGYMDVEAGDEAESIWIWNLASEGSTIRDDFKWLPLIRTLEPTLIVIFRGSLESILRPAMLHDGIWPWWVPQSWRGYASLDPRCYFSTTWWRKSKQVGIDTAKQYARKRLLRQPGKPLVELDTFTQNYEQLLSHLGQLKSRVVILGLLPVVEARFPHSPGYFERVNLRIKQIAADNGADFCDWARKLPTNGHQKNLFYRDGFHPNARGAQELARIFRSYLNNGSNV